MKKSNQFFTILFFPFCIFAQHQITGTVKDSLSYIEFANVVLTNSNNEFVKGTITDEKGSFLLEVEPGDYVLTITFIGYKKYSSSITVSKDLTIGEITLQEDASQLNEIVITAEKKLIERKVDRLVFNVEQSISASGGSSLDALKVTPRIRVQNDQISMIGKSGMGVLVDDRLIQLSGEDLTNFLKTIKSDDIKSIEVITNPPAKYEAEGNSGLINIKLKKSRQDSWNLAIRSAYQQASYPTGNFGMGFTYQKNKLTLFSDVNYTKGSIAPDKKYYIDYPEQFWFEQHQTRDFTNALGYKLGVDYKLSEKLTTGFQLLGSYNEPNIEENNRTTLTNVATRLVDSLIITRSKTYRKRAYNSINYHMVYEMDTIGRVLSLDVDYFKYRSDDERIFSSNNFFANGATIPNSFFAAQNIGDQDISNYAVNIDMQHPIKDVNFNYGGKLSFTDTKNGVLFNELTTGIPIIDPMQSNEFEYKEDTQALYVSASKAIGEKWEAQLGLRMESTQLEGNSITLNQINKNSYTELFPTAYLLYMINDDNTLSLNYGRRIDRPTFGWLNPFRWYSSLFSFSEGNPMLQPSFTTNIELEYAHGDNWINSIYYSKLSDGFEFVTDVDQATNTQMIVARNFIETDIIGLFEMVSIEPWDWLSVNAALNIYYSHAESKIPITNQSLSGWNLESFISSDIVLQKDNNILANVTYIVASDGVDNLDRNTAFSQLDASLKLFFLDKNLQITIAANDILSSSRPEYIGVSNNLRTSFQNYYDTRNFKIAMSYNLGKKIDREDREAKNEVEKERVN
ncbi:outer membrane beta-barrel family protein [Aquimarina sp. MMG016]|uniref:TonB-dependent receptor domain-containing protein n=1 Tax=Aquimarina sp. MMG016 TaxID=2822690 RepID=UPI001B39E7FE|nr:outer membrane beta-barrel family protein [Aquimarina sp. MMG016]MBQ4819270.1 TonB-dependent receptor [Aquimarina sp. MMG016]